MTSVLEIDETAAAGARRVLVAQLEEADEQLRTTPEGRDKAVHETRKRLKRARALLRLVRSGLPSAEYEHQNTTLRDLGRSLAPARDAWVVVGTLDDIVDRDGVDATAYAPLRALLVERHSVVTATMIDGAEVFTDVRQGLREARRRATGWDLEGDAIVVDGAVRTYGRARQRLKRAAREPIPERLHGWRKRAKDSGYHVEFLAPLWSPVLGAVAHECQVVWSRLGDDHDVDVLRGTVHDLRREHEGLMSSGALDQLDRWLDERHQSLAAQALALGRRVFAEPADAFGRRLAAYLRAWRDENPRSGG